MHFAIGGHCFIKYNLEFSSIKILNDVLITDTFYVDETDDRKKLLIYFSLSMMH